MNALIFYPATTCAASLTGLVLVWAALLSRRTRRLLVACMVLLPLTPIFVVRLLGVGIVFAGISIVRLCDRTVERCTTAQRHAEWISETFNL